MDFIVGLPKVGDLGSIFVVADRFSKYSIFIPASKSCNAKMAAQLFVTNVVKYWGVPQLIVSDETFVSQAGFGQNCSNCSGQHLSTSFHQRWMDRPSE